MFKRLFHMAPPSFPWHYIKNKFPGGGCEYISQYHSVNGTASLIQAYSKFFDYMGGLIMKINGDLDEMEIKATKREVVRPQVRPPMNKRKEVLTLEARKQPLVE